MTTRNPTREQITGPDIYTRNVKVLSTTGDDPVTSPDNVTKAQAKVMEEMVIERLLEGKSTQEIAGELVKGGWEKEAANQYVNAVEQNFKQSPEGRKRLAKKFSQKMLVGIFWVAGGITATMVFEGWIFWGAIVFGLWDILSGFVGWLKYN